MKSLGLALLTAAPFVSLLRGVVQPQAKPEPQKARPTKTPPPKNAEPEPAPAAP